MKSSQKYLMIRNNVYENVICYKRKKIVTCITILQYIKANYDKHLYGSKDKCIVLVIDYYMLLLLLYIVLGFS